MDKKYIVYKHTSPNGKVYIGITSKTVERRWQNGRGYKTNKHFYNAIKKYGWKNIKHEIIAENLESEVAYNLEKELIKKYKSNDTNFGYNHSTGGEVSSVGVKHSKETKEKWSIAHKGQPSSFKGKHHTEETKRKISEACKGYKAWNKGMKMSEEYKQKLSEAHKGQIITKEARKKIGLANKGKVLSKETRLKISIANKGKPSKRRKKVICLENGKIYDSVTSAENKLKIRHIAEVCNSKRQTAGGYHWKYF